MSRTHTDLNALASKGAWHIYRAFIGYNDDFRALTRRAGGHFVRADWHAAYVDAVARIELYEGWVERTLEELRELLKERCEDTRLWSGIRNAYAGLIERDLDKEFTKTFFSSITRRLFKTVGVNPSIEFVAIDARPIAGVADDIDCRVYLPGTSSRGLAAGLLEDYRFGIAYRDAEGDAQYIERTILRRLAEDEALGAMHRIETIREIFYQRSRAYIVGRMLCENGVLPFILALSNDSGIRVEAVLLHENEASILFGFARSYFHVDLATVINVVAFLKTIMPRKPVSELYTMLGRAKQGKTERYRSFFHHLDSSSDRFVSAAGQKGMVMAVFTLPSYDIVFKVIRDRFAYPKDIRRQDVIERYQLVFRHDRAGRLIDAQEFKKLRFKVDRFDPPLLEELTTEASATCRVTDAHLVVDHCYVERRMTPLDVYLRDADGDEAAAAVIDYGQAIRDLARSNIFPGDLLLKNFGVSRHGRVIFYDYDELCLLGTCRFRNLPQPRTQEEEMQSDAWFYVGENDIFPEQFLGFLGLEPELEAVFQTHHAELLDPAYWRAIQARIAAGEVLSVLPYRPRSDT